VLASRGHGKTFLGETDYMTNALALPTIEESQVTLHKTACAMANAYQKACAAINKAMDDTQANTTLLNEVFSAGTERAYLSGFGIDFYFEGDRYASREFIFKRYKIRAWEQIVHRLGIRNIMSVKARNEFDKKMKEGDLPDLTEEAIMAVVAGLATSAKDYAKEAALEVFDILRPRGHWGGQYKTNNAFRVGAKVVLNSWYVERAYDGKTYRINYRRQAELTAIDAVFHLLDGKGVIKGTQGPLIEAINGCQGRGDTEYFRFKCFKNHNLHLEFKRLDLVKQLNGLAAGEYVLGDNE
jgi:hypothetical protein